MEGYKFTPNKVSLINNTQTVTSFDLDSLDKLYYFHGYRNIRNSEFNAMALTETTDIIKIFKEFLHMQTSQHAS
jgi:hypothetical protein